MGIEKWTKEETEHHRATAMQCLYRHDHGPNDRSQLVRENCGACVLQGYFPRGKDTGWEGKRSDGPNYGGWARIYTEAGRHVPKKWHEAFKTELKRVNDPRYVSALHRSIATFGNPLR